MTNALATAESLASTRTAPRSDRRPWTTTGLLLALALLALHAFLPGSGEYTWWQRMLGALPGMAALYLGGRYLVERRFDRLPFIEYGLLHWYVFLGMPTITSAQGPSIPVSQQSLTEALLALDLFTICALTAYLGGRWLGRQAQRPASVLLPEMPSDTVRILFWPWLLVTAVLNTGLVNQLPESLHYPATVVGSYYPLLALEALRVHGRGARPTRLLIATTVLGAAGLFSGLMSRALTPLLTLGLLHTILRGRIPWRAVGMFFLLVVILQPAKLIYRSLAWEDKGVANGSIGQAFDRWLDALDEAWLGDSSSSGGLNKNIDLLSHRLDALSSSAACFELVPNEVPFDHGQMWKYLAVAPIPRALYPSKPNSTEIYNDRYNVTFGLQSQKATQSATFVFPITADGYWNFGWPGVVFVGLLMGVLLGFYSTALRVWHWGTLSLALSVFVDARFHGHLASQVGGLLQTVIGTMVVCWMIHLLTYSRSRR